MAERFKDKVVIVTGSSYGIGRSAAEGFAREGAQVVICARGREKLEEAEKAILDAGGRVTAKCIDLADLEAFAGLIRETAASFGRLDVLVNNAGIYIRGDALETSAEAWRSTLAVNLDAPFYLSQAALPHLLRSRGAIINIASDWGLQGGRKAAAYCASKGGLVLLTRAMALDHAAQGIRINAVCPGDVDTPMLVDEAVQDGLSHAQALEKYGQASPSGRVTRADEVAALVLYLASDQAAQINGAAIPIDGGNTA